MGSGQSNMPRRSFQENTGDIRPPFQNPNPLQSQARNAATSNNPTGGKVLVMNNDVSIQISSIKLKKNGREYSLIFVMDALCEVIVSSYFLVHEVKDPLLELTYDLKPDEKNKEKP